MSLQDRIDSLKAKHAALDDAISMEARRPYPNEPQISLLKRQKLAIKDELARLGPPLTH